METKNTLGDGPWVKNWVMRCGPLFCSLYGELYGREFKKLLGLSFRQTAYTCDATFSTQYLQASELESVSRVLALRVRENPQTASCWGEEVRKRTDSITPLLENFAQASEISAFDYRNVRSALFSHIAPNFAVKRSADFLPEDLSRTVLPELSRARQYCEHVYPLAETAFRKIAAFIAKREAISFSDACTLVDSEVQSYLENGSLPDSDDLSSRRQNLVLWYEGHKEHRLVGKDAIRVSDRLNEVSSGGSVRGISAFGGKAAGIARIVFHPRRVPVFNPGDILVAGNTRPDYLPLMEKAAAFVTDAGGMLSHAAIVARELKKPCLVGTENASKVFKDGDLIEVDAENGVVRKLS